VDRFPVQQRTLHFQENHSLSWFTEVNIINFLLFSLSKERKGKRKKKINNQERTSRLFLLKKKERRSCSGITRKNKKKSPNE
jgi:hypothetical protein